jgi:hypothetical protein
MTGCSTRASFEHQRRQHEQSDEQSADDSSRGPADVAGLDDPEDQRPDAERRAQRTDGVEPAKLAWRLGQYEPGADDHGDGDRHVDQKRRPPRDPVGRDAANEESEAGADAGGGGVPCDRPVSGFAVEVRRDQRERGRCDDRRVDALYGPAGDHPPACGRKADQQRRGAEDRQPHHEQPTPADDDVAGPRAEQDRIANDAAAMLRLEAGRNPRASQAARYRRAGGIPERSSDRRRAFKLRHVAEYVVTRRQLPNQDVNDAPMGTDKSG